MKDAVASETEFTAKGYDKKCAFKQLMSTEAGTLRVPLEHSGFPWANPECFQENPECSLNVPRGTLNVPGNIQGSPGNIQGSPGNIQGSPGNIQGSPGNIQGSPGNIQGSLGTFKGPKITPQLCIVGILPRVYMFVLFMDWQPRPHNEMGAHEWGDQLGPPSSDSPNQYYSTILHRKVPFMLNYAHFRAWVICL